MLKVTLKYTLLGRLWSICQVQWPSHIRRWRYMQGNSLRCEIKKKDSYTELCARSAVLVRFWSKWHWNMHYFVTSEVYAKDYDDRLAADGATCRGISSDATLESHNEGEILDIYGQSNIEIYIIGSLLKYAPNPATIARPWTELQAGQFPQGRN